MRFSSCSRSKSAAVVAPFIVPSAEALTAADAAAATPTMPAVAAVGVGAAGELGHAYAVVAFCVPPGEEEEEELTLELPEGFEPPLPLPLTLPLPPKNDPRRPPRDDCELLTPERSSPEMKSDESPSRAAEQKSCRMVKEKEVEKDEKRQRKIILTNGIEATQKSNTERLILDNLDITYGAYVCTYNHRCLLCFYCADRQR